MKNMIQHVLVVHKAVLKVFMCVLWTVPSFKFRFSTSKILNP